MRLVAFIIVFILYNLWYIFSGWDFSDFVDELLYLEEIERERDDDWLP